MTPEQRSAARKLATDILNEDPVLGFSNSTEVTLCSLLTQALDALDAAEAQWRPISEAPRDGTSILLFTKCHGAVEGWFSPGEWSEDTPISPADYSGAVWVCADDAFQIEVEETEPMHHGTATHWMPLPPAPRSTAATEGK